MYLIAAYILYVQIRIIFSRNVHSIHGFKFWNPNHTYQVDDYLWRDSILVLLREDLCPIFSISIHTQAISIESQAVLKEDDSLSSVPIFGKWVVRVLNDIVMFELPMLENTVTRNLARHDNHRQRGYSLVASLGKSQIRKDTAKIHNHNSQKFPLSTKKNSIHNWVTGGWRGWRTRRLLVRRVRWLDRNSLSFLKTKNKQIKSKQKLQVLCFLFLIKIFNYLWHRFHGDQQVLLEYVIDDWKIKPKQKRQQQEF